MYFEKSKILAAVFLCHCALGIVDDIIHRVIYKKDRDPAF